MQSTADNVDSTRVSSNVCKCMYGQFSNVFLCSWVLRFFSSTTILCKAKLLQSSSTSPSATSTHKNTHNVYVKHVSSQVNFINIALLFI